LENIIKEKDREIGKYKKRVENVEEYQSREQKYV